MGYVCVVSRINHYLLYTLKLFIMIGLFFIKAFEDFSPFLARISLLISFMCKQLPSRIPCKRNLTLPAISDFESDSNQTRTGRRVPSLNIKMLFFILSVFDKDLQNCLVNFISVLCLESMYTNLLGCSGQSRLVTLR